VIAEFKTTRQPKFKGGSTLRIVSAMDSRLVYQADRGSVMFREGCEDRLGVRRNLRGAWLDVAGHGQVVEGQRDRTLRGILGRREAANQ